MLRSALALCFFATSAGADIIATFSEGAPKDRFTLMNNGACALGALEVHIDLSGSAAGLIFDTTASGPGVEVFQPFELISGAGQVIDASPVRDGDTLLSLRLSGFTTSTPIALTIDVDDTTGGREITVSGSEIEDATVRVMLDGKVTSGAFDSTATAKIETPRCH